MLRTEEVAVEALSSSHHGTCMQPIWNLETLVMSMYMLAPSLLKDQCVRIRYYYDKVHYAMMWSLLRIL